MHYRNLVCDLDGTLIDSCAGIDASARHAQEQCLHGQEHVSLRPHIGPPLSEMFSRVFPNLGPAEIAKLVEQFRCHYDTKGWRLCRPFADVPATLRTLASRDVSLFILTNKPACATQAIVDAAGLLPLFSDIISPDSRVPAFNSKVEAALALQERHQLLAVETIVVGDGRDDQRAAEACGFSFVFAKYGYGADSSADRKIDSFADLLSILGRENLS